MNVLYLEAPLQPPAEALPGPSWKHGEWVVKSVDDDGVTKEVSEYGGAPVTPRPIATGCMANRDTNQRIGG
ncbi:MAG: hypothetical protein OXI51_11090 [Chloroflexota bacterium]|nr:hypothetical protein [Chloroflexota bacterium]